MRSTFRPNRICERQSSQNRHTGLKFSPKRENRALFIKLVHSALFRSCGTRFGQIAFVSVKVLKIVKLAQNSLQNGKTVRFPWKVPFYYNFHKKILQNALFRSCGELKNAIWPKRAAHDLKRAFCTIFIKTLCFPLLARISGQCADFENFHAQKFDFPKMCCAWPEKIVLFNFHEKRTVFPFWREFQARVTILRILTLINAIWPKRATHDP